VKALPDDFELSELAGALREGWVLDVELDYAPVGAGSYHWVATGRSGVHLFVTVDDLDRKAWLGDRRDVAFDGLRAAFETAVALRQAGLAFVVAPLPAQSGETLVRIGDRHAVAVFPFVAGRSGRFGHADPEERVAVASLLAELHLTSRVAGARARGRGVGFPERTHIEAGLRELDRPWVGGPFAEPARHALAGSAEHITDLLARTDRLAASVETRGAGWVVTHGEPHAGNVMRTATGRALVDWDTVALAPPERDLWMLVDTLDDEAAHVYANATGRRLDHEALEFFRLTWDLKDLAEHLNVLRAPHRETEDTTKAYEGLVSIC
jgi:spectinomycin phosphotransferase